MKTKDITDEIVCRAVQEYQSDHYNKPFPYEIVANNTGCSEKVAFQAMERAYERGYLEYGTSLRTSWLTAKGEKLIAKQD